MLTLAHRSMLGAASRPKPPVQLITLAGPSTSDDYGQSVAVDSSGNRFAVGYYGSPQTGFLAKLNSVGELQWQRKLTLTLLARVLACAVDSSGNVFIGGFGYASGSLWSGYLAKYNASGVLQWQRKLTGTENIGFYSLAVDASGDVFALSGYADTKATVLMVKYSSGGTLQWQRVISHATNSIKTPYGLSFDASGNVYFGALWEITAGSSEWPVIVKCNSSGVLQAAYGVRLTGTRGYMRSTAVDASGNIYFCGQAYNGATAVAFVGKLNSSGSVQWCRYFSGDASLQIANAVVLSADESSLFCAGTQYLFKLATADGALTWQRSVAGPASTSPGNTLVHVGGFLHAAESLNSMPSTGADALLVKLPDDGTGLGLYGSVIAYSEPTLTSNAGTTSTTSPTFSDAASSYTDAAGDMTDAAGTLTVTPYL